MLRTVARSSNSKTGPIAVTYRSGQHSTYASCPASCPLNPKPAESTAQVDKAYLRALLVAVPKDGQAWTYSHYHWSKLPAAAVGWTVINYSADTVQDAVVAVRHGRPAVLAAAPAETRDSWPMTHDGVRFVVCPEQLAPADSGFNCSSCGNGRPLCARPDRDYVIVFLAHGTGRRLAESDDQGGCYAATGPTAIQWHGTKTAGQADDAAAVRRFARSLPPGSLLRHHVAGDLGLAA